MAITSIKPLGVGINYRTEIAKSLVNHLDEFDFIEINTERLFYPNLPPELEYILHHKPVVLHGLTLSLGTLDQFPSPEYLHHLKNTLQQYDCRWFSEHIAVTNVQQHEIRALMPAEFTPKMVEHIAEKARIIQALSDKPFLLENITYYYPMPTNSMSEIEFLTSIIEKSGCGLLLDVSNLYVNGLNHGYDPYDFIDQLPLDQIVEVHLAGCDRMHGMMIDTHASAVKHEVFDLFMYLCEKTAVYGVIIERDDRLDKFEDLIEEVQFVKTILRDSTTHAIACSQ